MITATIKTRVDDFGEPEHKTITYAVPDSGGYVRFNDCAGPQVMDPRRSDGSTLMWYPTRDADCDEIDVAFRGFMREMRRIECRAARRELSR